MMKLIEYESFRMKKVAMPALLCALVLAIALFSGCSQSTPKELSSSRSDSVTNQLKSSSEPFPYVASVVWAVNVGGDEASGVDGVEYRADESISGGEIGILDKTKGSQDGVLYESYRIGDIEVRHPIQNGLYDIIFKFAEPADIPVGERVFDVFAEGQLVIDDLDVRKARDNKIVSALERAAMDVRVADGRLDITFEASTGEPILSAIVVRRKYTDPREWELDWADEFDYEGPPDPSRWNIDIWRRGKANSEDQTYTDFPRNVRVENGVLVLEAHKEDYNNAHYTSGRINSQGKGDILYGRVEVRAKLPRGQGTWPAIWMLPSDPYNYATNCVAPEEWQGSLTCDAWPNSGEIDIMEHVGFDMQTIHGTVHNKAYYWVNWEQRKASVEGKNVDEEFHVYSLEWTPDYIYIFLDGSPYFFYLNEKTGWKAWPFDKPFNVILNLAIGGDWGRAGGPIDNSLFPTRMEVDYVRVYKPAAP
jgi:beta-glucanase (GH16 family)